MKNFETENAETMCLELTIVEKKWCILFVYHPPNTDKDKFFDKISAIIKYQVNMKIFLQVT